jgi:hypothetical protein
MNATILLLGAALLLGDGPARPETQRKPHPLAPSLPELSDDEEARIDKIIDRFILYDKGKLRGAEGKQALSDFQKLGPEAIPALIRGLNRAAAFEHSCPAVVIGKKLARMFNASNDLELLEFARENIGAGTVATRHQGFLRDLRVAILFRKRAVLDSGTAFRREDTGSDLRTLTVRELATAASSTGGTRLKLVLSELGRRPGDEALSALGAFASSYDGDIQELARKRLADRLNKLNPAQLKEKLKDDRAEIRAGAARTVASKGLRFGSELIALLDDEEAVVRNAARQALVRLSKGLDYGPDPDADAARRAEAIKQWQTWWQQKGER